MGDLQSLVDQPKPCWEGGRRKETGDRRARIAVIGASRTVMFPRSANLFSQVEHDVVKRPYVPGKGSAEVVVPAGQLLFVLFFRSEVEAL